MHCVMYLSCVMDRGTERAPACRCVGVLKVGTGGTQRPESGETEHSEMQ